MVQVYGLDALKERLVERHVVGMLGEHGLYLLRQGVHLIGRLCAEEGEEHGRHPVEQPVVAAVVVGIDDGIVESGLGGVVDGLGDLLVIAPDAFDEGLFIVLKPDFVEGDGVVGRVERLKERVDTMGGVFRVFGVLWVVGGIVHCCFAFIPIIDRHDGFCLHGF